MTDRPTEHLKSRLVLATTLTRAAAESRGMRHVPPGPGCVPLDSASRLSKHYLRKRTFWAGVSEGIHERFNGSGVPGILGILGTALVS